MAGLAMLRLGGESAFVFVMVQAAEYRVCPIPWPQPTTVCCSGSGAIFEALPLSKQVAQSGVVLAVNVFHASKLRQTQSNATHLTISFFHFFFRYSLTFPSRGAAKRGNIRFVYERIGQIRLLWLLLISWRSGQYRTDRNRTEPDPEPNRTEPNTPGRQQWVAQTRRCQAKGAQAVKPTVWGGLQAAVLFNRETSWLRPDISPSPSPNSRNSLVMDTSKARPRLSSLNGDAY